MQSLTILTGDPTLFKEISPVNPTQPFLLEEIVHHHLLLSNSSELK
jgi:hypothetical protein